MTLRSPEAGAGAGAGAVEPPEQVGVASQSSKASRAPTRRRGSHGLGQAAITAGEHRAAANGGSRQGGGGQGCWGWTAAWSPPAIDGRLFTCFACLVQCYYYFEWFSLPVYLLEVSSFF